MSERERERERGGGRKTDIEKEREELGNRETDRLIKRNERKERESKRGRGGGWGSRQKKSMYQLPCDYKQVDCEIAITSFQNN